MKTKLLTKEQVLQKLRHYCRYQERCCSEVKNKLFELGFNKNEHGEIIKVLTEENYLNEERFATAFAAGRFAMKQWGRRKIYYALKEKKLSDDLIQRAIAQINEADYLHNLRKRIDEKYASLKDEQYLIRKRKTMDHLIQKGYEPELIKPLLEKDG